MRKWRERDIFTRAKENQRNLLRQLLERAVGKVLAQAGVERITVEPGEAFDPTYHEGIELRHGEVDQPTVAAVIQLGYLHENELLRPASVVVVKPIN